MVRSAEDPTEVLALLIREAVHAAAKALGADLRVAFVIRRGDGGEEDPAVGGVNADQEEVRVLLLAAGTMLSSALGKPVVIMRAGSMG